MSTVPEAVAVAFLVQQPRRATPGVMEAVTRATMTLGLRREVCLDRLEGEAAGLADDLLRYFGRCKALWAGGPGSFVALRRPLVRAVQQDRQGARCDLTDELAALSALPGVGPFTDELTEAAPDGERLRLLGHPHLVRLVRQDATVVAELHVTAALPWPQALGGVPTPGEVRRVLTLTAAYAKWRDRRSRRLHTVDVHADEVWPAA